MNTTFALLKKEPKLDGHGELTEKDQDIEFVTCAYRSNDGLTKWKYGFDIIAKYLADNVPVYPLDNSPQGIFTIGDIKKKINEQNKEEDKKDKKSEKAN